MSSTASHLSQSVRCSARAAYEFARNPANLPLWAAGLGGPFVEVDGSWLRRTPEGDVRLHFAEANDLGVLDHTVVLPDGTSVHNPMRVLPDGDDDCDVVFTLRRRPGTTDEDFDRDAAAVAHDLVTLKRVLESQQG